MDPEFIKRLEDYFTSAELVEALDVPIGILVDALYDIIQFNQNELQEYMNYGR